MDNRINDKDLEFVTGGAAATDNLQVASDQLRRALSLFTDDMPESARSRIEHTAVVIDRGSTDVFIYIREINTAINELQSFGETNPDKFDMVPQILHHLNNALMSLNNH